MTTSFCYSRPHPLEPRDISMLLAKLLAETGAASLVSTTLGSVSVHLFQTIAKGMSKSKDIAPNGAIYISRTADYLETGSLYQEPLVQYSMPMSASVDIDVLEDLERVRSTLCS